MIRTHPPHEKFSENRDSDRIHNNSYNKLRINFKMEAFTTKSLTCWVQIPQVMKQLMIVMSS